ncbi:uncharacterized protein RAG0_09489 [Rhynchosporium agropyri]|uniref:Uncharacterized protein n=1 Tax=Rhynchosporium agropyri TaxID=914238 RepID=A0A1E1KVQ4_9HELO|nr:uncharacterized protein RAG0_09489 [Rhynchosporium agropyri]
MFNQGYFRLQRNIPLGSSPRDIVRLINANISSWMASNQRNFFAFYVKNDGSSLRHGFARYMEHSKYGICTDSENFGLLPAILCVSGNLHYSMLPVLAYMSWVDWNSKYPDSPPGGLSATGLLLVYLLSTWMMLAYARKVGWNIALVQCGRTIRQRAFKAEWDLGKEFRSPDQQLRWWKNMIIDETSEGKDPIIKLGFGEPEIVSRYLGKSNLGPYADAYADAGLLEDALLKVLKEE